MNRNVVHVRCITQLICTGNELLLAVHRPKVSNVKPRNKVDRCIYTRTTSGIGLEHLPSNVDPPIVGATQTRATALLPQFRPQLAGARENALTYRAGLTSHAPL